MPVCAGVRMVLFSGGFEHSPIRIIGFGLDRQVLSRRRPAFDQSSADLNGARQVPPEKRLTCAQPRAGTARKKNSTTDASISATKLSRITSLSKSGRIRFSRCMAVRDKIGGCPDPLDLGKPFASRIRQAAWLGGPPFFSSHIEHRLLSVGILCRMAHFENHTNPVLPRSGAAFAKNLFCEFIPEI